MDAFDFDNLKTEKANALLRYRRLQNVAKLFRLLEALIFLSWTSSCLPFLVTICSKYLRLLKLIILSPLFIFLLGNVIFLTLLAMSGRSSAVIKSETSHYHEFTKNIENLIDLEPDNCHSVAEQEEIVYQDKQKIICEVKTANNSAPNYNTNELTLVTDPSVSDQKVCQSEILNSEKQAPVDEPSNEEFQRTIEAFIAKQLRFHKKEKC